MFGMGGPRILNFYGQEMLVFFLLDSQSCFLQPLQANVLAMRCGATRAF